MKQSYLAFEIGSMQKTVYPLLGPTTIGRSADNTITLPDPTTSRNHARVVFAKGKWVVEDLGSANGILIGGQRVKRLVLKSGDTFKIGAITFRFIEKEILSGSDQLFETVEILASSSEDRDSQVSEDKDVEREATKSKPWSERLQEAVAAIPFFSPLSGDERKKLADEATLHVFNAGEIIIREGDPGRSIYVILDGQVRVFIRDHHGEELELAVLGLGQFFGEMSFLTGKPRSGSVSAQDTSVIVELSYTSMRRVVKEHPTVKKVLVEYYQQRLGNTERKRAEVGLDKRTSDSRHKERIQVKLVVLPQTTPNGALKASSWTGVSVDLTLSGIVVGVSGASPEPFQLQSEVRLEIDLPQPWGETRTLGVIRRVKPARTNEKMVMVGIDYVGIAESDAKKLRDYLSR
ncbi:MAG: cyclic nucleotide-binding domain-containing protein [Deltaproteobacteria bacterium]|jgi:CRP-like cAMP-binding protein